MFFRRAWQRVGPLARWLLQPTSSCTAPVRHMAFGVPGGSSNMAYVVLCGGGLTAAVVYAYKTVNGDTERYEDRLANMSSKEKGEVTLEVPLAKSGPADEEPAPGAKITAEPVPAPPEPAAQTSSELAHSEDSAIAAVAEADVTEASAESAESEEAPASEKEEETAPEAEPAEDAAAESAAVQALASSTLEIINAFVAEDSLVKALPQMEDDGNELKFLKENLEPDVPVEVSEVATKEGVGVKEERSAESEEVTQGITIEELCAEQSLASAAGQEEEESLVSFLERILVTEDNSMIADSAPEEVAFSSEARSAEEDFVVAEATSGEEVTHFKEVELGTVGPSVTEPESPSPMDPEDKEESCHNCQTSPSSSKEAAPLAGLKEDLLDVAMTQEAKEESSPLRKQTMADGVVVTAQS